MKKTHFTPILFAAILPLIPACTKAHAATLNDVNKNKDSFHVVSVSPQGSLSSTVKFPSIQVQFSKPLVALEKLGQPSDKNMAVTIDPPLKGVFRWYGTSLLSFDCSDQLIPQMEYTIKISPNVTSIDGDIITGPLEYHFRTEDVKISYIEAGYSARKKNKVYVNSNDLPLEYSKDFAVHFTNNVDPSVIIKHLTLTDENKKDYKCSVSAIDKQTILLTVKDSLPANTKFTITLKKGAQSAKNSAKTLNDSSSSFHTVKPFVFKEIYGTSSPSLFFNHRIKSGQEKAILEAISTSLKTPLKLEQIEISGNCILLKDLDVTYGQTFTIKLKKKSIKDVYGQLCSSDITRKVKVNNASKFISFEYGNNYILESQFEPKRAFVFQNFSGSADYKITPLAGVRENFNLPKEKRTSVETYKAKLNRKYIQTIDLKPYLEKIDLPGGPQWRGALKLKTTSVETLISSYLHENSSIIQVTDLAVTVHTSWNRTVVLVTNISTGLPVSNAEVKVIKAEDYEKAILGKGEMLATGKSDSDGMAVLSFDGSFDYRDNIFIDVKTSDDRVVTHNGYLSFPLYKEWDLSNSKNASEKELNSLPNSNAVTKIFSDRYLYKPGETAKFKIIDRNLTAGIYSTYKGSYTINIVDDSRWRKDHPVYATFEGTTSDQGSADFEWKLPEDLAPGSYYVEYKRADGKTSYEDFQVQFFEKLKFSAGASITENTYFSGDNLSAEISASYLGGGALQGASVNVNWERSESSFSMDDTAHRGWSFTPAADYFAYEYDSEFLENTDGILNEEGKTHVSIKTGGEKKEGTPYNYSLEADVTDASNQMIAARDYVQVHPAYFYIGLSPVRSPKAFPQTGEKVFLDYELVTPDGKKPEKSQLPSNGKVEWKLIHTFWDRVLKYDEFGIEYYDYEKKEEVESSGSIRIPSNFAGNLTLTPKASGDYKIEMTSTDSQERKVISSRNFFVVGSKRFLTGRGENTIELSADKELYKSGETAHLLLNSSLEKGCYLMTIEREGILSQRILKLDQPTSTIDIEIKEEWIPSVFVSISGFTPRSKAPDTLYEGEDSGRPVNMTAVIKLSIDPSAREFNIDLKTDKQFYKPGQKVSIDITASKKGRAIENAELTLMVVDRGVLDLTNYRAGNPVDYFYSENRFGSQTNQYDSRVLLKKPVTFSDYDTAADEDVTYKGNRLFSRMEKTADSNDMRLYESEAAMMASEDIAITGKGFAEEDEGEDLSSYQIRKNFASTAVFIPALMTDKNGKVHADFTLPDSLTEYVITVVGVKDNDYGYKTDSLKVTNPIAVRDAETSLLRIGDLGEVGVTITNNSDETQTVTVNFDVISGLDKTGYIPQAGDLIRSKGQALATGEKSKTVKVKSGETLPVMFKLKAKEAGWITLQFKITSDELKEIIYKELEIEKPYVFETVTSVNQIPAEESLAKEKILFPSISEDNRLSFYVQLDSTRLGTLHSSVDYLFHYPYGCLEQRSSAILPLMIFGDYIEVFDLNSEVSDPKATVQNEINDWANFQKINGGYPYWKDSQEASFAVSLRLGEILSLAKERGFDTGKNNLNKLSSYIKSESKKIKNCWYPQAYTYYILSLLGEKISRNDLTRVIKEASGASEIAYAGLTALNMNYKDVAESAAGRIKNLMSLTTRGASFQDAGRCWYFFNGESERFALALMLFTRLDKNDIYNHHIVYQLLELQRAHQGFWKSTSETSRVLIALENYIRENDLNNSNLTAEALLGENKILQGQFSGAGAKPVDVNLSYTELMEKGISTGKEIPLQIKKEGEGPLFYTLSMKYALPAVEQIARDEGLCIYTEIINARTGQLVTDNVLEIGQVYKQKVYITTTKTRTFVAVRAPVPAGCEILNSAFATTISTGTVEEESGFEDPAFSRRSSISHQDIYKADIRCFWNYLPMGTQSFEFIFRPVRAGEYDAPGILGECMYETEVFGRSSGKRWIIK